MRLSMNTMNSIRTNRMNKFEMQNSITLLFIVLSCLLYVNDVNTDCTSQNSKEMEIVVNDILSRANAERRAVNRKELKRNKNLAIPKTPISTSGHGVHEFQDKGMITLYRANLQGEVNFIFGLEKTMYLIADGAYNSKNKFGRFATILWKDFKEMNCGTCGPPSPIGMVCVFSPPISKPIDPKLWDKKIPKPSKINKEDPADDDDITTTTTPITTTTILTTIPTTTTPTTTTSTTTSTTPPTTTATTSTLPPTTTTTTSTLPPTTSTTTTTTTTTPTTPTTPSTISTKSTTTSTTSITTLTKTRTTVPSRVPSMKVTTRRTTPQRRRTTKARKTKQCCFKNFTLWFSMKFGFKRS